LGHTAEVTKILWNKKIEKWISASDDGTIRVWNGLGKPLNVIRTNGGISALGMDAAFGYVLAASSIDHVIRVYDVLTETVSECASQYFNHCRLYKKILDTRML
jgi:WD40 repeat protein